MIRSNLQRGFAYLGVIAMAASFIGLGIWQFNRAQESQIPVRVDTTLISLQAVTQPRIALPSSAVLRHVQVSGKYISDFQAPNQLDSNGKSETWQVGLLEPDSGGAILVVRGLLLQRNKGRSSADVTITGILMPHQSDDHALSSAGVLARLDSSLVVNQTSLDLYDGYVIADGETVDAAVIARTRISPPAPKSAVPGFYWQHISYVVVWWLMAGVVLYLPFYQRRIAPEFDEVESE
ncbi:MAG: SURF1 family cytochrome oxidase biogenesis protein [Actinomycetota bacterium]